MQPVNVTNHLSSKSFPVKLETNMYQVVLGTIVGSYLFSKVIEVAKQRFPLIENLNHVSFLLGGWMGVVAIIKNPVATLTVYFSAIFGFWAWNLASPPKDADTKNADPIKNPGSIPSYLIDMTESARQDNSILDIGECKYFEEIEIVLNRTKKNNIVFVGKAGVGKTAIIESIAKKIANNQVSPSSPFANKKIWSLDLATFMIGTKYVGELEARMAEFLLIAKKLKGIFFIDEIHMIVGAGRGEGANRDVAGFLKNALARRAISVIGATTPEEYLLLIKDPAFVRRFQCIHIDEPSLKECFQMFLLQIPYFQKHYPKVILTDIAIAAAVFFAKRDIRDRSVVDATYDLIDNTCSAASLKNLQTITELDVRAIAVMHARFCTAAKKFSVDTLVKQFNAAFQQYPNLFQSSIPENLPAPT